MELQKGLVVQLKSGGPYMTIGSISVQDGCSAIITCGWFDETGLLQNGKFDPIMLTLANGKMK